MENRSVPSHDFYALKGMKMAYEASKMVNLAPSSQTFVANRMTR